MATVHLVQTLRTSFQPKIQQKTQRRARTTSRPQVCKESKLSKSKYEALTNCTKQEQKEIVWQMMATRRREWKHDYYKANNTFSVPHNNQVKDFPSNNKKYNVQFLDRSLNGKPLNFPTKQWGLFTKPADILYSSHYKPIVEKKRQYNEEYQLRTSSFGETWVDLKRDRVMDKYKIQTNPFRTPRSNNLISTMKKDSARSTQI